MGDFITKWEEKSIDNCIELIYGQGLPESIRIDGNIPVYGSNGIAGHNNKSLVKGPGIIIGRKGSVGKVICSKVDFWPIDTTYYVKLKPGNDLNFWYYFLKTLDLESMNSHSAVPGLNRNDVYKLIKNIPDLKEQKAIAKILFCLDSKIELNNQMNANLEAIAQAIFKHWFVDFEFPDENGKPYKSSGGKMIESELGKIPEGWMLDEVGNNIKFIKGKKPKEISDKLIEGYLPQILIDTLDGGVPMFAHPQKVVALDKFEPIMVMDGASSGRIEIGFSGILGSTLAKIIPRNSLLTTFYILFFLKTHQKDINENTTGTSIPHADKGKINHLPIVVPNEKPLRRFDTIVQDIIVRIITNKEEIKNLQNIRDSLLPKLMSGQIKVPLEVVKNA